jgi:phosphatidylinositol glycan class B
MNSIPKNWLWAAIILHLLAAWFSVGHYHDDEYAQILNFTTSKIGIDMQSQLMWEFEAGVRSGFQPFVAYTLSEASSLLGINSPFILSFVYRLISAAISLLAIVVFIRSIANEFTSKTAFKWAVFFLLFSWLLVFTNVRFSSEGWACSFFILALGLYRYPSPATSSRFLLVGLCFGLAFLARYQMGFALLGFGLWMLFINKQKLFNVFLILFAGFITLVIGAGFDFWLYGEPTVSSWNYFIWHYNGLLGGGISTALPEPWWFYAYYSAVQIIPPLTLLLPFSIVCFWIMFPKHPVTWLSIPFVLFHTLFGHKEMRYLFPLLPFAPFIFAMVAIRLNEKFLLLKRNFFKYAWYLIFWPSVFINIVLVILILSLPASKEVALWQNCLGPLSEKDNPLLMVLDQDGSYSDPAELNMDFYNTNQLEIISVQDESYISEVKTQYPERKMFFASRKRNRSQQLNDAGLSNELICQALPDWILKININDWTSRTSMWRVWSISN